MQHFFKVLRLPFTVTKFQLNPHRDLRLNPDYDFYIARPHALSFVAFYLESFNYARREYKLNPFTILALLMLYLACRVSLIALACIIWLIDTVILMAYQILNIFWLKWLLRGLAVFLTFIVVYTTYQRISRGDDPCQIRMIAAPWDPGDLICNHVPWFTADILWLVNVVIVMIPVVAILVVQLTPGAFMRWHLYLSSLVMRPLYKLGEPLTFIDGYLCRRRGHQDGTYSEK